MTLLKKITAMALLGALGAAIGAALGESLFVSEPAPPESEPREICLLFDISGSMNEMVSGPGGERYQSQLEALKIAACDFIARQDLASDAMGLAVFASGAHVVTGLGHDAATLQHAVMGLAANGGTNLGRGLDVASTMMRYNEGERWILLFSDGKPESSSTRESPEQAALSAAMRAREAGIKIVAIGTPLADAQLLAKAAGTSDNVIVSDATALAEAFQRSEEVINNRQMLASQAGSETFRSSVTRTGAWAGLIAIGAALGLVIGQNRHMRRRTLGVRDGVIVAVGGVVTGLLAGAAGQTMFYVLSDAPAISAVGRVAAWALLGCGVGYGMGFFVPNLHRTRAGVAGLAGGVIAAFCFLTLVPAVGDTIGRLLGAAILGLAAGMTTVLIEAACRQAVLVVHWSEKEKSDLALGATPILVGRSPEAHVLLADEDSPAPIMARIKLADGKVHLTDGQSGATRTLGAGEVLTYGRIRLEVGASARDLAAPAAPKPAARQREEASSPKRPDPAQQTRRQRQETAPRAPAVSDSLKRSQAPTGKWYEKAG